MEPRAGHRLPNAQGGGTTEHQDGRQLSCLGHRGNSLPTSSPTGLGPLSTLQTQGGTGRAPALSCPHVPRGLGNWLWLDKQQVPSWRVWGFMSLLPHHQAPLTLLTVAVQVQVAEVSLELRPNHDLLQRKRPGGVRADRRPGCAVLTWALSCHTHSPRLPQSVRPAQRHQALQPQEAWVWV